MLSLQDREWEAFLLSDIFPKMKRGKRLKKADHQSGTTPYVSSSAINNGVDNYVSNSNGVRRFSNGLTVANSGSVGKAFYHPYEFVASDHVTHLQNPEFSPYIYRFLAPLVSRLEEKYSFNREINDTRLNREYILLPVTPDGLPDWQYMEDYIKEREAGLLREYIARIGNNSQHGVIPSLKSREWETFTISSLFKLETGKGKGLNHLRKTANGVSYLGATNRNNGVLCYVERDSRMMQRGNGIAFIRNGEGSIGYSVYKAEPVYRIV